jgi:hypothetical protein
MSETAANSMGSNTDLADLVWEHRLTAMFNVEYYTALRRRYSLRDKIIRGFLALTSSSAIAGLAFWASYPSVWQSLAAATAVVAVLSPVLGYSKLLGDLGDGYGRWVQSEAKFEDYWERLELGQTVTFEEYEKAKTLLVSTMQAEIDIPVDDGLRQACYQQVISQTKPYDERAGDGNGKDKVNEN